MYYSRPTQPNSALLQLALPSFLPLLDLMAEVMRRRQLRRIYGQMSKAQLRDIGLTHQTVALALSLPIEHNAEDALVQAAAREAAKW